MTAPRPPQPGQVRCTWKKPCRWMTTPWPLHRRQVGGRLLELLLRLLVPNVAVGVILHRQTAVGLGDRVGIRLAGDLQNLVKVTLRRHHGSKRGIVPRRRRISAYQSRKRKRRTERPV